MNKKILILLIIVFTLPLTILITQETQKWLGKAAYKPANLIIDTRKTIGTIDKTWSAFAQGGEESPPMLSNTISLMRKLSPRYIRLDHIYDYYNLVKKDNDKFVYDFSELDKTVDDIIAMGALPFFSLSYMPSSFTASGKVTDVPSNWNYWKDLIKATIEHYSGRNKKNLDKVYYEVWNEPELPQFGAWKMSSEKDYRQLYYYANEGAKEAQNTNNYYFGGPAVGSYYPEWLKDLVSYTHENNLRLDFYSWHRYTKNPEIYSSDAENTRKILSSYPKYTNLPLIITEWGFDSENTAANNTSASAAYVVSAVSKFYRKVNLAFAFEIKDGPPPFGGKWGIITHEKDPQPLSSKLRYKAFAALNSLSGQNLFLDGESTFIKAIATKYGNIVKVIIANYDSSGERVENVPITFKGLVFSSYKFKYSYPLEEKNGEFVIQSTNSTISKTFIIPKNSILLIELAPLPQQ